MRTSRDAAGLSLEALAAVVKVPVRKLEALEAGRLDALPESVYVREDGGWGPPQGDGDGEEGARAPVFRLGVGNTTPAPPAPRLESV